MTLPFVLAGPILRRVQPNLVSVWVAFSRPAAVTIALWEGRIKTGATNPHVRSDPAAPTVRFGDRLHVTAAVLRIPDASEKLLKPGLELRTERCRRADALHTSR